MLFCVFYLIFFFSFWELYYVKHWTHPWNPAVMNSGGLIFIHFFKWTKKTQTHKNILPQQENLAVTPGTAFESYSSSLLKEALWLNQQCNYTFGRDYVMHSDDWTPVYYNQSNWGWETSLVEAGGYKSALNNLWWNRKRHSWPHAVAVVLQEHGAVLRFNHNFILSQC